MTEDRIVVADVKLGEKVDDEYYACEYLTQRLCKPSQNPSDPLSVGYHAETTLRGFEIVGLDPSAIRANVGIFGERGTGKTKLLQSLLVQLAARGRGFCFIEERDGDAVQLLGQLPDHRLEDVLWIESEPQTLSSDVPDWRRIRFSPLAGFGPDADAKTLRAVAGDLVDLARQGLDGDSASFPDQPRAVLFPALADPDIDTIGELERVIAKEAHPEKGNALQHRSISTPGDPAAIREAIQAAKTADSGEPAPISVLRRGLQQYGSEAISQCLVPDSGLDISRAVDKDKIIIVSGRNRKAFPAIQTTLLRRFWLAAQQQETAARPVPYPIVLDGLATSLPGAGSALRDCLRLESERFGLLVGGLAPEVHPDSIESALRNHVETMLVTRTTYGGPLETFEQSGFDTTGTAHEPLAGGCFWLHRGKTTDPLRVQSFPQLPQQRTDAEIDDAIQASCTTSEGTPPGCIDRTVTDI